MTVRKREKEREGERERGRERGRERERERERERAAYPNHAFQVATIFVLVSFQ